MKFIGIQAGHQNIENNVDPSLRPETGAPGEMQFNVKVRDRLGEILIKYGFQVQLDDANANSDPKTLSEDFDLYLAIHAEFAPPGGEVAAPDPSVDASNTESKRIVDVIESVYFSDTGIADVEKIDDGNMDFYYMWNVLTAKTPCAIIECGDLNDSHDSVILADINRVALAIAHGICVAFNIDWKGDPDTWTPAPPMPPDPCADIKKELDAYKVSHPDRPITSVSSQGSTSAMFPENAKVPLDQPNHPLQTDEIKSFSWIVTLFGYLFRPKK